MPDRRCAPGPEFTFYADRLLNFLIEQAIAELPTEETVRAVHSILCMHT